MFAFIKQTNGFIFSYEKYVLFMYIVKKILEEYTQKLTQITSR